MHATKQLSTPIWNWFILMWALFLIFVAVWTLVETAMSSDHTSDSIPLILSGLFLLMGWLGLRYCRGMARSVVLDLETKALTVDGVNVGCADGLEEVQTRKLMRKVWVEVSSPIFGQIKFVPNWCVYSDIRLIGAQAWWKSLIETKQ